MWRRSSASSRSPTAPAQPSLPSARASWTARAAPPGVPASWLRWLHVPLAAAGLAWVEPAAWPRYLTVVGVLALEWPFCIRLTEGVEVYMPVMWTSAAAAYVLGSRDPARLLGGGDPRLRAHRAPRQRGPRAARSGSRRNPPAAGAASRSTLDSVADGDIRHSCNMAEHARARGDDRRLRAGMHLSLAATVVVAEGTVAAGRYLAPISGRMAPARTWTRIAEALGPDMPRGDAPAAPGDGVGSSCWRRSTGGPPASRPPACPRSRCTRS